MKPNRIRMSVTVARQARGAGRNGEGVIVVSRPPECLPARKGLAGRRAAESPCPVPPSAQPRSGCNLRRARAEAPDGNGNVVSLSDGTQTVVASYRYDPFGNTMAATGTLAAANTYRFSSKDVNPAFGLYYYGYRWYAPGLQRWVNRDPVGENGGINLYAVVRNSPLTYRDALGFQGGPYGDGYGLGRGSFGFRPCPVEVPEGPAGDPDNFDDDPENIVDLGRGFAGMGVGVGKLIGFLLIPSQNAPPYTPPPLAPPALGCSTCHVNAPPVYIQ